MEVWKLVYADASVGMLVQWHPTYKGAVRAQSKLRREYEKRNDEDIEPSSIEAVDIETDKVGLILWLNTYCNTDNG